MHGDGPTDNDFVANPRARRVDLDLVRHNSDARSVDKNLIGLATIDHFGVASHKLDLRAGRSFTHRLDDAPEIFHRQAFLEDKTGGKIERPRATHGEIVDRTVDRKSTRLNSSHSSISYAVF